MYSLRSKIAVIGAGRVSYSLVNALIKSGFNVSSIISRRLPSAKKLASKFKIKDYSSHIDSLSPEIKIFFLAVPDNQILSVAQKISKLKMDFKNSIFIHLSGAEDVSILKILQKKKAAVASFHIMQSFPAEKIINLKGPYAAVETNSKKAEQFLFRLAKKIYLHPFKINSKDKLYYHIAGVYSSNFLVANQYTTSELFKKINSGIDYKKVFLPILETTLKNVRRNKVAKALSGPVERGDMEIVKKHLKALKSDKILRSNYIFQSLTLLKLLKERDKKLSRSHKELEDYLIKHYKNCDTG